MTYRLGPKWLEDKIERMCGWVGGWLAGWTDGQTDGRTDGQTDRQLKICGG